MSPFETAKAALESLSQGKNDGYGTVRLCHPVVPAATHTVASPHTFDFVTFSTCCEPLIILQPSSFCLRAFSSFWTCQKVSLFVVLEPLFYQSKKKFHRLASYRRSVVEPPRPNHTLPPAILGKLTEAVYSINRYSNRLYTCEMTFDVSLLSQLRQAVEKSSLDSNPTGPATGVRGHCVEYRMTLFSFDDAKKYYVTKLAIFEDQFHKYGLEGHHKLKAEDVQRFTLITPLAHPDIFLYAIQKLLGQSHGSGDGWKWCGTVNRTSLDLSSLDRYDTRRAIFARCTTCAKKKKPCKFLKDEGADFVHLPSLTYRHTPALGCLKLSPSAPGMDPAGNRLPKDQAPPQYPDQTTVPTQSANNGSQGRYNGCGAIPLGDFLSEKERFS